METRFREQIPESEMTGSVGNDGDRRVKVAVSSLETETATYIVDPAYIRRRHLPKIYVWYVGSRWKQNDFSDTRGDPLLTFGLLSGSLKEDVRVSGIE